MAGDPKPKKIDPKKDAATVGTKFSKAVVSGNSGVKTPDSKIASSISNQFDYTRQYVNSPMYKQRLNKMVNTERALQNAASLNTPFNAEVYQGSKLSDPNQKIIQGVVDRNNTNLNNLSNKISVGDVNLGNNVAGGYDSSMNDVRFNQALLKQNPTVPGHEFSHGTNDGLAPYSPEFHNQYIAPMMIDSKNSMWSPEVQKPTELKARLDAVRGLASQLGIYDAKTEKFTPEHLKKLQSNPRFQKDFNFKQIQDQLNKDHKNNGFIWLMNNIANQQSEPIEGNLV